MLNRTRPREPTRLDRQITRSVTRLTEERVKQKPRLNASSEEYKPDTHRGDTHEVPLPHRSCGLSLPVGTSTLAFAYPCFNSETNAATHVRLFLNVWNAYHMAQHLPEEEAHQSKMKEFGLTLDGRAAFWHSQIDLPAITTFDELQSKFLRFFHKKVPQHVIIGQFLYDQTNAIRLYR